MSEDPYSAPKTKPKQKGTPIPSPFYAELRDKFRYQSQLLALLWLISGGLGLWSFLSEGTLALIPLGMSAMMVCAGGLTLMGKVTGIVLGLGMSYIVLAMMIYVNWVNDGIPGWLTLLFGASIFQGHRLLFMRKKMG